MCHFHCTYSARSSQSQTTIPFYRDTHNKQSLKNTLGRAWLAHAVGRVLGTLALAPCVHKVQFMQRGVCATIVRCSATTWLTCALHEVRRHVQQLVMYCNYTTMYYRAPWYHSATCTCRESAVQQPVVEAKGPLRGRHYSYGIARLQCGNICAASQVAT